MFSTLILFVVFFFLDIVCLFIYWFFLFISGERWFKIRVISKLWLLVAGRCMLRHRHCGHCSHWTICVHSSSLATRLQTSFGCCPQITFYFVVYTDLCISSFPSMGKRCQIRSFFTTSVLVFVSATFWFPFLWAFMRFFSLILLFTKVLFLNLLFKWKHFFASLFYCCL